MIEIDYFLVIDHGDTSVGIFPSTYKIEKNFQFESEEDVSKFKEKILEAFEYVCETKPYIFDSRYYMRMENLNEAIDRPMFY